MTHEERIIFDIAKLNKAISNAQLPDDLKNHLTCFNRLLNAIYEKYSIELFKDNFLMIYPWTLSYI